MYCNYISSLGVSTIQYSSFAQGTRKWWRRIGEIVNTARTNKKPHWMRDETGTQMLLEWMSFIHNQYCIRAHAKVPPLYSSAGWRCESWGCWAQATIYNTILRRSSIYCMCFYVIAYNNTMFINIIFYIFFFFWFSRLWWRSATCRLCLSSQWVVVVHSRCIFTLFLPLYIFYYIIFYCYCFRRVGINISK